MTVSQRERPFNFFTPRIVTCRRSLHKIHQLIHYSTSLWRDCLPAPFTYNSLISLILITIISKLNLIVIWSFYYALGYSELCAYVIHEFLRFTALWIIGLSKVWYSHQLNPNLDSVSAINGYFYCSTHTHTTFDCKCWSAASWFGLPTSTAKLSLT